MYPCYKDLIVSDCREEFPLSWILAENALHLAAWVAAGWLVWPLRLQGVPVAAAAWAALVVSVQLLLKKHNCSGCYYHGKACHLGWGKLSAWLCRPDSGNMKTGVRLSFFYILSPPAVVAAAVAAGILSDAGPEHWVLLGVYVALNAMMFPVRKKGCGSCAMRKACPGSASGKE